MAPNLAKKLVIISIMGIVFFIFGIINVDERQNAIVTNLINKKTQLLEPGLHFAWPFLDQTNYIFMNKRNALFTMKLDFADNKNVEVSTMVEWQVQKPLAYFAVVENDDFNKGLVDKVRQILEVRAKTTNLYTFNQLNNLLSQPVAFNDLGVSINRISPNELKLTAAPPLESANVLMPLPKLVKGLSIESAYYQAQMIKTKTEIEQAKMYQSLEGKEPRFYASFRKLQIYKTSAKSKQDMPPLDDLYK